MFCFYLIHFIGSTPVIGTSPTFFSTFYHQFLLWANFGTSHAHHRQAQQTSKIYCTHAYGARNDGVLKHLPSRSVYFAPKNDAFYFVKVVILREISNFCAKIFSHYFALESLLVYISAHPMCKIYGRCLADDIWSNRGHRSHPPPPLSNHKFTPLSNHKFTP